MIALYWQSRADIDVRATISATDMAVQGIAVRATFTNDGLSGATVRDVELLLDGKRVATAEGTLADPSELRGALPYQADVSRNLGPPTIAVGPRSTLTVALVFDLPTRCSLQADTQHRFACMVIDCRQRECFRGRVDLRMTRSPGGAHVEPVRLEEPSTSFVSWEPLVHPHALGLARHGPGAQIATDMVHLRLWRLDRPRARVDAVRPVIGQTRTWFPLENVPPGRYTWVFSNGSRTLVAGFLKVCGKRCPYALYGMRGRLWRAGQEYVVPVRPPET